MKNGIEFESEEKGKEFIADITPCRDAQGRRKECDETCVKYKNNCFDCRIALLEEKGYIKQSNLEKARDDYYSIAGTGNDILIHNMLLKYKDALEIEIKLK